MTPRFQEEAIDFLSQLCVSLTLEYLPPTVANPYFIVPQKKLAFAIQKLDAPLLPLRPQMQTVYLWEDIWVKSPLLLQSRIKALFGISLRIHGRKTKAKRITEEQTHPFVTTHHLNGNTKSKFKYGLFVQDDLVAVATFSSAKNFTNENGKAIKSYELIRFCSQANTTIVGGLSKLLQCFIQERDPDEIMTYIDLNWSNGASFKQLGFRKEKEMPLKTLYVDPHYQRHYQATQETLGTVSVRNAKLKWYKQRV